ncbi:hypothetical protein FZF11_17945 [Vibrio parahaemolyticus]|nr:hypothetical protein [Vibrio parahaemolyticus]MQY99456.1 hypothetical protein [Vibrio parahaemolyticus]MQZ11289.1 hypothetical protein [Vibrio parahaemolyticus]NKJ89247.1 hypothetical protein [Vibrio parahaemolyticus]PMS44768.1 hypothetical protein C1S89_25150 [Vibrio parahaemolyticus]
MLNVSTVRLPFLKVFLVLSACFLRRCMFQVVSVTSCFETTPDLPASKYVGFLFAKSKLS